MPTGMQCPGIAIEMNKTIIKFTPFGPVVIIWDVPEERPKITRVLLSKLSESVLEKTKELYPMVYEASCEEIDFIATGMLRFLEGEAVDFSLDIADLDSCGEFQQRVLRAEHGIPRGKVSTYKLIAACLGVPGGARAVGNALANNPFPLIIPCHRAIRSDLTLGGYQGGLKMKHALLSNEGIVFNDSGKVQCSQFFYENETGRNYER